MKYNEIDIVLIGVFQNRGAGLTPDDRRHHV